LPTFALLAQGEGTWSGWSSLVGGTTGHAVISDSGDGTNDGDTSYLVLPRLTGSGGRVSFPMFASCAAGHIESIMLRLVARNTGGNHPQIEVGFVRGPSAVFSNATLDAWVQYTTQTWTFATNPFNNQPWQATDLVGLEPCFKSVTNQLGTNRVTLFNGAIVMNGSLDYGVRRDRGVPME
jgi:hypothetical protein